MIWVFFDQLSVRFWLFFVLIFGCFSLNWIADFCCPKLSSAIHCKLILLLCCHCWLIGERVKANFRARRGRLSSNWWLWVQFLEDKDGNSAGSSDVKQGRKWKLKLWFLGYIGWRLRCEWLVYDELQDGYLFDSKNEYRVVVILGVNFGWNCRFMLWVLAEFEVMCC